MSARVLDGKVLAAKLKEELAKEVATLKAQNKGVPRIVSIIVGNEAASISYATSQQKAAESLGIHYTMEILLPTVTQAQYINMIHHINADKAVHGLIINKPLPKHIRFESLINEIHVNKDLEGLNLLNLGRLLEDESGILPCTPAAAMGLLKSSGVKLAGKEAVVIGRSQIVGKPMALLLLKENMTVTVCHSKTQDLAAVVRRADVVVAAIGKPLFVKGDWIKPGAIVIDIGINQEDGKIVGDVDFDSAKQNASFITPVPGGVGPVTSVMLMKNAIEAFKVQLTL